MLKMLCISSIKILMTLHSSEQYSTLRVDYHMNMDLLHTPNIACNII